MYIPIAMANAIKEVTNEANITLMFLTTDQSSKLFNQRLPAGVLM
jgi:hypothetical protein